MTRLTHFLVAVGEGTFVVSLTLPTLKEAASQVKLFETFSLSFSISLFVIRVNLLHPYSFLYPYGLLLCL